MASVGSGKSKSAALVQLEIALGKKAVSLDGLSWSEFDDFLRDVLENVRLREVRGFTPLKELLTFQPGSVVIGGAPQHTLDVERLDISEGMSFEASGFEKDSSVDWETHTRRLCRGWTNWKIVFKRHETGEETEDRETASSWGRSAFHFKGKGEVLAVRRPRNHSGADENLIIISFCYEKVPLESRHVITKLKVEPLPIKNFRQYFGASRAKMAVELIRELESAYSYTAQELESQSKIIRKKAEELERLSEAITYNR